MIRFDTDAVPVHRGHRNYFLSKENAHWVAVVVWAQDLLVFVGVCVSVSLPVCGVPVDSRRRRHIP